jgi:hypothetical protein
MPRGLELVGVGGRAREPVGAGGVAVLEAHLHVVEARVGEGGEALAGHPPRRGDEVGVEPRVAGGADEGFEVVAQEGLAAGEVHVQRAELAGLAEHAAPRGGVELVAVVAPVGGVGAVRAAQRAAVGELGEEGDGGFDHGASRVT